MSWYASRRPRARRHSIRSSFLDTGDPLVPAPVRNPMGRYGALVTMYGYHVLVPGYLRMVVIHSGAQPPCTPVPLSRRSERGETEDVDGGARQGGGRWLR